MNQSDEPKQSKRQIKEIDGDFHRAIIPSKEYAFLASEMP
jgi:hypothetical protein